MIPKRPVALRDSVPGRRRPPSRTENRGVFQDTLDNHDRSNGPLGATGRARCDRDDEFHDAVWLYAWSQDALHPIGKAVLDHVVIAG
jgi:hypothetical protein